MDFFAHQDAARRASRRLGWAMAFATIGVVIAVNLAVAAILGGQDLYHDLPERGGFVSSTAGKLHLLTTVCTLAVILGGSLFKMFELRGGGRAVAEALGGREIHHATADEGERRLLNIVEEMALASGVPRPPVFLIPEDGINAFAAGLSPDEAAIGVTRGAIDALPRAELQGVIAHEFSHILNGDMRLNIRLIALIAGLMGLVVVGRIAFEIAINSRPSSRDKKGGGALPILLIGLALMAIGGIGWLLGRIIQAAFSRSREFLADASAVQFTRDPSGIAGALARIRSGYSRITHPRSSETAHLFFANALGSWIDGLFATHPPLDERIRRLGAVPTPDAAAVPSAGRNPSAAMGFASGRMAQRAGSLTPERVAFGATLLSRLPDPLVEAAQESVTARAVVLLPLLTEETVRRQMALIARADSWLASEVQRLRPHWTALPADQARLPLLQLAIPSLRRLSDRQRRDLFGLLDALAAEDGIITLREFLVLRYVRIHLSPPAPLGRTPLARLRPDAAVILGVLARMAGRDAGAQMQSFSAGWAQLSLSGPTPALPEPAACAPLPLAEALDRLRLADGAAKRALVTACAAAVAADGVVNCREAELFQVVCDQLGVPMPPFQHLHPA